MSELEELREELKCTKANLEEIQKRYRVLPKAEKDKRYVEPAHQVEQLALERTQGMLAACREKISNQDKALIRTFVIIGEHFGMKLNDLMKIAGER